MRISGWNVYSVELPFRRPFHHAAKTRETSSSVFVECRLEDGTRGFGECLPRDYVTGEDTSSVYEALRDVVLPALTGRTFDSLHETRTFLEGCGGLPPVELRCRGSAGPAAWCAVDLALLDAFGRSLGKPLAVLLGGCCQPVSYSAVLSMHSLLPMLVKGAVVRRRRFRHLKLKVGSETAAWRLSLMRRLAGSGCEVRLDANMSWTLDRALELAEPLKRIGIGAVEQPFPADDLRSAAELVRAGMVVIADEGFSTRESLGRLSEHKAASGVNIRISKCGGLIASLQRAEEARERGLLVQIGCQVGESSLLSAANLVFQCCAPGIRYAEGCYGRHLLREDPGKPVLEIGSGGEPPALPAGGGFGVELDREILCRYASRWDEVGSRAAARTG